MQFAELYWPRKLRIKTMVAIKPAMHTPQTQTPAFRRVFA
ncbi:hypothetical protein CFBP2533_42260 [Xanthomonas hortorum pv. pelargonii]|uniref:Uncharacterized protein n=1 Tax=Xanthomonas hortorum pv. pelargonii TaxID=453602 RepID=A0A6V7F306_9XANT|nr:hypothetical protein CFBP2533_42260 [Xanthomonas hortorum pv. pelargonii]CAD0357887.1 hypothetical protein CFBP2533_42260 [Xanthomonas hortorum pv. pelargonii]